MIGEGGATPHRDRVMEIIESITRQRLHERYAVLEQACEEAVQSGKYGVVDFGGINIRVSTRVPYGMIYVFPNAEALGLWLDTETG